MTEQQLEQEILGEEVKEEKICWALLELQSFAK